MHAKWNQTWLSNFTLVNFRLLDVLAFAPITKGGVFTPPFLLSYKFVHQSQEPPPKSGFPFFEQTQSPPFPEASLAKSHHLLSATYPVK